jgi:fructose-1,6-bisphosphatase I
MPHTARAVLNRRNHPLAEGAPACGEELSVYLDRIAAATPEGPALAELLALLARGAIHVAEVAAFGSIAGDMNEAMGSANQDGDVQKRLDLVAHEAFIEAIQSGPVAAILSEESQHPIGLDPDAPLVVAIDPLDGSSNINANISIGTIFSVYPAAAGAEHLSEHFLRPGSEQLAAGFVIYGPQTSLALTTGDGTHIFTLDRRAGVFRMAIPKLAVPLDSIEYAVNASNYRYWDDPVRAFIDDCIQGADGPLRHDYNMRWIASLVADAYRILIRGGIFLYPGDARRGYRHGRLRHIYEANPIALLLEQAGGAATDTVHRILELRPKDLHVRTPIVFGSLNPVNRMSRYHTNPQYSAERAPLFFQRGLIRR